MTVMTVDLALCDCHLFVCKTVILICLAQSANCCVGNIFNLIPIYFFIHIINPFFEYNGGLGWTWKKIWTEIVDGISFGIQILTFNVGNLDRNYSWYEQVWSNVTRMEIAWWCYHRSSSRSLQLWSEHIRPQSWWRWTKNGHQKFNKHT